ncbi:hypothetical protein [Pseudoalteromonas luteoviolacea]|uniref:Outer membrane protein beta-barrel domain-containing protein n=1 Tax=Pseudoalteromonas luteoviolacea S4060-1 TaxID=1365257 RepID=A0A167NU99_9GAMM|nr:hypothetical protein [Pseudoalteromonas luteoviolacea]KZN28530.1 hypothetical protein N480_10580 [Pseudoalteromonas luteoviolacea S2607]KZN68806.1 hypothetical protein N478_14175 [Pseudoalteromonas luteoviolacea S4060-1]
MLKVIFPLTVALASFSSHATNFEFSSGIGTQYGGLIGVQAAIKQEKSKYFAGLGLFGVSAGMQYVLSEDMHHALGFNTGRMFQVLGEHTDYVALNYNYHVNGFHNSGWELGTGIGYFETDESSILFSSEVVEEEKEAKLILNIGYKF